MARATKARVDAALANNAEALRVAELLRDFFRYMSLEFGYILPDSYSDGKFTPGHTPAKFSGRTRCNREVIVHAHMYT